MSVRPRAHQLACRRPTGGPPGHLADLTPAERRRAVADAGWPAYRAAQLSRHYFVHHRSDPAEMTDLPLADRERLASALLAPVLHPVTTRTTDRGATRKTLWQARDGVTVESVLMRYPGRVTVCVSSQAGCGMGCPFCATGQAGLQRNLTTAEIVEQVVAAGRAADSGRLGPRPARLTGVVFMGMGEPLANYRAVLGALCRCIDAAPDGMGLAARAVTVSTVGLVPAIRRLAGEGLRVRLAVSLHAPDDELRDRLVPVNRRWPVSEVLAAAWHYAERNRRRVSVEYTLIDELNDQPARASALARLLAGAPAHVNLIPLNPTPGVTWRPSPRHRVRRFAGILAAAGVPVSVRDSRGRAIDAACGQLAATGRDR